MSSQEPAAAQLLEMGCLALDPISLKIIPDTEFTCFVKPEQPELITPAVLARNKITEAQLAAGIPPKIFLSKFNDHVRRFFKGKSAARFNAPFPAGRGINRLTGPVLTRYCEKYGFADKTGEPKMFSNKWSYDLEDDYFRWLGQTTILPDIGADTVREHFKMKKHDDGRIMHEVRQSAWVAQKFLGLYRGLAQKIEFTGAADGNI